MKRFAELFRALDGTTRTSEKVAAMVRYFAEAPPEDAAWAVRFLCGERIKRTVSGPSLRRWAGEAAALPDWLVKESHAAVGDLAETIHLLLPPADAPTSDPLHVLVAERVAPLPTMDDASRRALVRETWRRLDGEERFLWHKLITGAFRVGVQRGLVARALAEHAGLEPAVVARRLMGGIEPTAEAFRALVSTEETAADAARPYPFFLASPREQAPGDLGPVDDWIVEWKWDGIRAQLVRRGGEVLAWSRGEEVIGPAFPELVALARALPEGTVLDGELVAWDGDRPAPFARLQRRLNRTSHEPMLFEDVPVRFLAFDVLESEGQDRRAEPIESRLEALDRLVAPLEASEAVARSARLEVADWDDVAAWREGARAERAEGLMLKRRGSPYRAGRVRGDWWKWKVDPYVVDAVVIAAQVGHGRRASLLTDYTFGVWDDAKSSLVPVAKAYSGLSDEEIDRMDAHLRRTTADRRGAYRAVEPTLVMELAFEGIQSSDRHRSGLALRFPRIQRWRHDKPPAEAGTLAELRALLATLEAGGDPG